MKKLTLLLLCLFMLTGCAMNERRLYTENLNRYESYWKAINDNDKFAEQSRFYSTTAKIEQNGDSYKYSVTIDNPKIAMYGLEVIVVENNEDYHNDKMMPSAGIFDGEINMVPNQVSVPNRFMGGISISGDYSGPQVDLYVLVTWRNASKVESQKEYLKFSVNGEVKTDSNENKPSEKDSEAESKDTDKKND